MAAERTINGKSIMGVLMLAAACGATICLQAEGADQEQALEALVALVEDGFGENAP
jgi:phosphocarrier protein